MLPLNTTIGTANGSKKKVEQVRILRRAGKEGRILSPVQRKKEMLIKTTFSAVPINAEFMLGSEDFIKEDETKAKNVNDGLFEFFEPDTEVYLVKKIYLKHLF